MNSIQNTVARFSVAPAGALSVTVNVSLPSAMVSAAIATVIVRVVSPVPKVSVPLAGV